MGLPTLSIIVATAGTRPTLARTLSTLVGQTKGGDEVLVCPDGPARAATVRELVEQYPLPGRVLDLGGPHGDWGHTLRNRAMPHAKGSWLLFMDDDDGYLPARLEVIRDAVAAGERVPHVFRMSYSDGRILWSKPVLEVGNVSTIMVCVPNDPARLGTWGSRYEGDFDFIVSTAAHYPSLQWREEVIAAVRPWGA